MRRQEQDLGSIAPGQVIGTALALVGAPSPFDATFSGDARYICWPVTNLRTFLDKRPELRSAIQRLVNRDLAHKLERLASSRIDAS
jgi:CRP-like cAMP-binding protein